jgi:hypothetical protein
MVVGAVTGCAWLAAAAPALATVTSSNVTVTSPSGAYLLDDEAGTPNETIAGSGTTVGSSPGDKVNVNCYYGITSAPVQQNVPLAADGTFIFSGPLANIANRKCVLRAVPAGDATDYAPGSSSSFSGPILMVGQRLEGHQGTGQNASALTNYDLYASQAQGAFEYLSLGDCTIGNSFLYDPVSFATSLPIDFCNAWFYWENGQTGAAGVAAPTRSELEVDGAGAYLAGNAHWVWTGASGNSGYPGLSYRYSIDPGTGNLVLDETDEVVVCSPQPTVYPPSSTSCSKFVPAGVQVKMHITQTDDGLIARVEQYFTSTDGRSHAIDLLEDNDFYHPTADGAIEFPWRGATFQTYVTPGQVLPGPSAGGPGSFFVEATEGTPNPQGSVTFSNPPDSVDVISGTNSAARSSWLDLHYARTVPATGSVALGFTYGQSDDPSGDAAAAQASYRPTVSISALTPGVAPAPPQVTVSGLAGDVAGVTSVTVNGQPASIGPGGAWSAVVPLSPGINPITAVATNVFGNTAQAQDSVIYTKAGPGSPGRVSTPPIIGFLHLSHATWRERGRAHKGRPPVGTTFSFTLTGAARVTLSFTEQLAGRRVAGRCVAPSRANRHAATCRRTVSVGTIGRAGHSGLNRISFKGTLAGGRKLAPGRYTVTIMAVDPASGAVSTPKRLTFTIVK